MAPSDATRPALSVSVVIATYNRAALLRECLRHLADQPFGPNDEVVIIDNGSADETPAVLEAAARHLPARLLTAAEPLPGKSRALARALRMAGGDVLAFIDDDVNVQRGWLEGIRAAIAGGAVLAGGPVRPRWEAPPPRWLVRPVSAYGRLSAPLALLDYGTAVIPLGARTLLGANMAVRREVLDRVGGFAPHLGKLRGTLLSGEDAELCQRIVAAGLPAVYSPVPTVEHWVPAHRMRLRYVVSWFFWSGITHATLDGDRSAGRTIGGAPLYLFRRLLTAVGLAMGRAASGRLERAAEHAVDAAFAAGYIARRWHLAGDTGMSAAAEAGEPA